MADVRMAKIVTGEIIIALNDTERDGLKDVAVAQIVPSGAGVSIALLPFGFPFEEDITGFISNKHVVYEITKFSQDIVNKYTEAKSNIRIATTSGSGDGQIIL